MAAKLGAHEIVENIIQLALEKQKNDTSVSERDNSSAWNWVQHTK